MPTLANPAVTGIGSTTVTPRVGIQFEPTWLANLGLSVGGWGEITGTALSSVAPSPTPAGTTGPSSKVVAWTSFVAAGNAVYSVANGGHADYSGNEVNKLDLSADAPAWVESLAPTASGQVSEAVAYYGDGRPTSRHTYYGKHYDPEADKIMLIGGAWWASSGGKTTAIDAYNVAGNTYDASGSFPSIPSGIYTSGSGFACARDAVTGDIWMFGGYSVYQWDKSGGVVNTVRSSGALWGYDACSAWDSTRNRFFVVGANSERHTYDPATDTLTQQTLTGGDAAAVQASAQGMVYVPSLDKFLVRKSASGGAVYTIDASTFAVAQLSTIGGASVPVTDNGPYNKFLYLPNLGVCVYTPTYSGNAWVIKVE